MAGYYQFYNATGQAYSGPSGARAYIRYLTTEGSYYAVPLAPEATFALAGRARDFLGVCPTFAEWMTTYYPTWKPPIGPDVIPCAYGWITFAGEPKAPAYQTWRDEWQKTVVSD